MLKTENIAVVTGHRPSKIGQEYNYDGPYTHYLRTQFKEILLERNITTAISGMALGVDTIYCQTALELEIPVIAAVPFKGQELKWPKKSQQLYQQLLDHPLVTTHIVSPGSYSSAKMQIRNNYMIDYCLKHSAKPLLIAAWNLTPGGTMNCVRYAETKKDLEIIFVNPENWKTQLKQSKLF